MGSALSNELMPGHRHPRLDDVHRMIADRSCSVLSLDIFDTVLWRRVPRPTDLFAVLGSQLRRDGLCPSWVTDASFRQMRIAAEHDARSRRGSLGTEVSLFDIWREMPLSLFGEALLEELVQAEVELERSFTVVDLDVAHVIALAQKHDIPVVLVSDTYFTEDQLSYLLDRPELGPMQNVRVFRSHQHGADKASGLWPIVLNELGRRPDEVVHIGDNEVADHEVPSSLGIRTVHYERLDEAFTRVLDREHESTDYFGAFAKHFDPDHGDFGITSLRAKTLQSGSRATTAAARTAWRYGASVLGPALTGFAEWVALKAHNSGTSVVWCPMREGEMLAELINNAARARGWNVQAKPVWLSRHVTSVAALDCADTDSVHEFILQRHRLTVRQLLTTLSLRPGDVPALAEELDTVLDTPRMVARVSVALTETPHLKNRLAVTTTASRERLLKALRDAGALNDPDLMLVDLGWGGTIQFQLARVLQLAQTGVTTSGLYLATDERSTRLLQAGLRAEGYLGQAGHPREIVWTLTRSPEVIEQCVNALCGSLIDFDDNGSPVLGPQAGTHSQNVERKAAQDGILAFQQQWNRYVGASDGAWPDLTGSARDRLANILTSSLKVPTAEEASVFGNWQHEDNFGSSVVTRVLPDDLVPAIPYLSPNDLDDLHMRDSFWPALIAASDTRLSAAARALATGLVDPTAFEPSGDPFETRLRFRTADDRWHDGPRRRVRINHNGLSFARINFDGHDVLDVSLAIPGRPAIVRIDWIEARVISGGDPVPRVLRWDQPDDFAGLTFADCTWLGANMVEFDFPHSAMWLPVAARSGAPVTSAQVTVAFAMLPQSISRLGHHAPLASRVARLSGRMREEYRARGAVGIVAGAARIASRQLENLR
jgi:FMN phosphatase YigB (HAD superfamily)